MGEKEKEYVIEGYSPVPREASFVPSLISRFGNLVGKGRFGYEPFNPDILVSDEFGLDGNDLNIRMIGTAGHSPGSIGVIVDEQIVMVGDSMFGIFPHSIYPPFSDDPGKMIRSWKRLLKTGCETFLPGHGDGINRVKLSWELEKRSWSERFGKIRMNKRKFIGLYRLFRFDLSFAAGTCVLLGELLAVGSLPSMQQAVFGFLSVFFISAAALILNDYFDIEMDRINAPQRPLPSGMVTRSDVIILFIFCTLAGSASSMILGIQAFLFVIFVWAVGFMYNWKLKRYGFVGNCFVAFSVGMTFIFGGVAVGRPFEMLVWFMGVVAFLIDLGEEIAADSIDVQGDRESGSRSLAVVLGPERAMRISAGVFSLVIVWSFVPFVFGWMEWPYLLPLTLLDLIIVFSTMKLLDPKTSKRLRYVRVIYLGGLGVIIMMMMLRLFLTN